MTEFHCSVSETRVTADAEVTKNNRGSRDSAALRSGNQAQEGFEVSHPIDRNKDVVWMGHPRVVPGGGKASARTTADPSLRFRMTARRKFGGDVSPRTRALPVRAVAPASIGQGKRWHSVARLKTPNSHTRRYPISYSALPLYAKVPCRCPILAMS